MTTSVVEICSVTYLFDKYIDRNSVSLSLTPLTVLKLDQG